MIRKYLILLLVPIVGFSQTSLNEVGALFQDKQYSKAEGIISNYLKEYPGDLYAIELYGDAYGFQKKWDEAIASYKKLVNTNPNSANYQYKYGGALGMKALSVNKFKALGIIGDVKEAFEKAAELDPNHIDTRWALVELYMQLPGIIGGSKSKSIKYANELEQLSKVDGYLAKGYIYAYDNEDNLAEKYYKMAVNEGGSLTCYNKLTGFYESKKQPEKAIQNIEEAQKKHINNALYYQLGKVVAENNIALDKGENALQTYLKNYNGQDGAPKAWAQYRLAQIYLLKKNKIEALKYINSALAELPKSKLFLEERDKILSL